MASNVTADIIGFHRSLVDMAREQPEYQPGRESALYGYSEGVEHGMEVLVANGYRKAEYARTLEDLKQLPPGVSIFDGTTAFTVSAASPCTVRTWVGAPDAGWFPETAEAATTHLPAIVLRPAQAPAAVPALAIEHAL